MILREAFEDREEQLLSPLATLSKYSKGRTFVEEKSSTRTEFQRDRDRVVHSKAFRRLKHKTQVFVTTAEGDHYRTRLTHSLEVAQIARHLARVLNVNEDLTETIALAHDLGHTPFGHTGEKILNKLMQEHGGFEHNRQSRRIVEELEKKYVEFPGMNLTHELLEGMIKHRTPYDHTEQLTPQGPSLEAQICNIADEIAYNSHDLDDGLYSKLLSPNVVATTTLWQELTRYNQNKYSNLSDVQTQSLNVRRLIHLQISSVIEETEKRIGQQNITAREQVLNLKEDLVAFDTEMAGKVAELRKFLYAAFYHHPEVKSKNQEAEKIITTLFEYYLKNPQQALVSSTFTQSASIHQATCDYIASMSDQFAINKFLAISSSSA